MAASVPVPDEDDEWEPDFWESRLDAEVDPDDCIQAPGPAAALGSSTAAAAEPDRLCSGPAPCVHPPPPSVAAADGAAPCVKVAGASPAAGAEAPQSSSSPAPDLRDSGSLLQDLSWACTGAEAQARRVLVYGFDPEATGGERGWDAGASGGVGGEGQAGS